MASKLSEQLAVVACIDPDAYGTGAQSSDVIDMSYHQKVMFIVMVGDLGTGATVDFKVQECATSNGTFTDISGKSITQLTKAGTDDNKQAIVEVDASELGAGKRYVKGVLTIGGAASDAGVVAVADASRYQPASDFDLSSVDEIVA